METVSLARRSFLRGRTGSIEAGQRPPWALGEADFLAHCTRCEACIGVCPTGILSRGDGAYPVVDFRRGECSFCAACVEACQPSALRREAGAAPWRLVAVFSAACLPRQGVECRVCGECCEQGAISFRPRVGGAALPALSLEACTGCGACVAPCPAQAIVMESSE